MLKLPYDLDTYSPIHITKFYLTIAKTSCWSRAFITFGSPLLMKIRIIWPSWSGKTQLGLLLHRTVQIPLFHTDHIVYKKKFVAKTSKQHQAGFLQTILDTKKDRIIEWTTIWHTRRPSIVHADLIIYCDQKRYVLRYRIVVRYFRWQQSWWHISDLIRLLKYACDYRQTQHGVMQTLQDYKHKIIFYPRDYH